MFCLNAWTRLASSGELRRAMGEIGKGMSENDSDGMEFYFLIFENIDRRLLLLVLLDLVLREGDAHDTVEIVSGSLPNAASQVSIEL